MVHKNEAGLISLQLLHSDLLEFEFCRPEVRERDKSDKGAEEKAWTGRLFRLFLGFFENFSVAKTLFNLHKTVFLSNFAEFGEAPTPPRFINTVSAILTDY